MKDLDTSCNSHADNLLKLFNDEKLNRVRMEIYRVLRTTLGFCFSCHLFEIPQVLSLNIMVIGTVKCII